MKAFMNDPLLKARRVKLVKDKIKSGQLVHGTYGEEMGGVIKGCAAFVTTCQTDNPHSYYEKDLGIPNELSRLEDVIFEGLKAPHDKTFPVKFLEAIEPGADLSRVSPKFQYWLMLENLKHEKLWREQDKKDEYATKVVGVIKQVAKILKTWYETGVIDSSAADSARSAAYSAAGSAAYSAADSACSAACSAYSAACSAVYSAYSAACSAYSAACSAAYSAACSAKKDFYIKCSKKLLELMQEVKA